MDNAVNEQDSNKTIEVEIDVSKKYKFPKELVIVKYNDTYLVIYTQGIMWLVLQNKEELRVFKELQAESSIEDVMKKYNEDTVLRVIMQIEAKRFEYPVKSSVLQENNIYIYLTNNCNQRCKHCYMYAGEIDYDELKWQEWVRVLSDFKEAGGHGVTFTGGEVTIYEGFENVIMHAHNLGLYVTVLSNGIMWTEEAIIKLSEYIDEIQISMDGYDSVSYYSVRQYDGFDKAINTIKFFYNHGVRVSLAVTPLYEGIDEFVKNFEVFAKQFMVQYPNVFIKLNLELLQGREISISKKENREYKEKIRKLVEKIYPNYYIENFVLNFPNKAIRNNCGFGEISIAPNGDVFWCNRIHELKSNMNVLSDNFKNIMNASCYIKEFTSVDNTLGCKTCDVRYVCGGGCRMEYEGIFNADEHNGEWFYHCMGKEQIYEKMILSNEYFFEE
ncbi:MAG: radical SAM protein [Lachnospira sp.]|nr:radical SAM protein [Lachnospira sp.]